MTEAFALPLPPNATALEASLAVALAPPDDLRNLPATLDARLASPSDDELPFLIWEWGLGPVAAYLEDPRTALRDGRIWQKKRGTIGGGDIARLWLGVTASHEQNKGKRFQLHLDNLPADHRPNDVAALSELSKSARNSLVRITHRHDGRGFRVNKGRVNSLDCVEDWTGVPVDNVTPLVSFATVDKLAGDVAGLEVIPSSDWLLTTQTEQAWQTEETYSADLHQQSQSAQTIIYDETRGPLQPPPFTDDPLGLPSSTSTLTEVTS